MVDWSPSYETLAIPVAFALGLLTRTPQPAVVQCVDDDTAAVNSSGCWLYFILFIFTWIFAVGAYHGRRLTERTVRAIAPRALFGSS